MTKQVVTSTSRGPTPRRRGSGSHPSPVRCQTSRMFGHVVARDLSHWLCPMSSEQTVVQTWQTLSSSLNPIPGSDFDIARFDPKAPGFWFESFTGREEAFAYQHYFFERRSPSQSVHDCARLYLTVLGCARLCSTVLAYSRLRSTVIECTSLCSTVPNCSRLCSTVLDCF